MFLRRYSVLAAGLAGGQITAPEADSCGNWTPDTDAVAGASIMENLITTVKSVSEIIDDFRHEQLAVPEIQRDVVWSGDQIKSLIDSVTRGYPCGSLILWEPREKDKALVKSMIRPERLAANGNVVPRYFLLDGQQRITALASVLLKREIVRELLAEMDEDLPFIFARIGKHLPYELEATADAAGSRFPWILLNRLFDGSFRNDPNFRQLHADTIDQIQEHVQQVRDYKFPVQIIRDRDYPSVGEIFTRVNSAGTQLTGAEIHLARIVPHWKGITKEFRGYRKELVSKKYDLDLTFLMRSITVIECDVPQIKKLADRISKDKPSRVHLNKTWKHARGAIDRTIKTLQQGLSLDKSKFFTSKNALVPLVYSLAKVKQPGTLQRSVLRFFILSQLSEHYGGGAETALRKDFRSLTDSTLSPKQALADLAESVNREARQSYRGLNIKPGDVEGLSSKNVLVLLMYILMRQRGATDWGAGRPARLDQIEPRKIQLHHLFPFDYMTKHKGIQRWYTDNYGYSQADFRREINDIANLTFLSQAKNVEIKENPPFQYLKNETTKEMRKAHFIPEDPHLWKTENFPKFLEARRRMLADAMSRLLKHL